MRLDPTKILGGIFEYYSNTDTCLLEKIWGVLIVHGYSTNVYGLSYDISQLKLPIFDAETIVRTED